MVLPLVTCVTFFLAVPSLVVCSFSGFTGFSKLECSAASLFSNFMMRSHPGTNSVSKMQNIGTSAKPVYVGQLCLVQMGEKLSSQKRKIFAHHEIIIGRNSAQCHWAFGDPFLSEQHLRIYTVAHNVDGSSEMEYLVYAEDVSRHGTFWNESLIGRGNGGFLLTTSDRLRLSSKTTLLFEGCPERIKCKFDLIQEKELKSFRKDFVLTDRLLGRGTFGQVFMAIEQKSRIQVACKVVDLRPLKLTRATRPGEAPTAAAERAEMKAQLRKITTSKDQCQTYKFLEKKLAAYFYEVQTLMSLRHPNVLGFDKMYLTDSTVYMFSDLIGAGDLLVYLESKNSRALEVEAAIIVYQVLIALEFLHGQSIAHGNIVPENIMVANLSTGCRVVLVGFGAARCLPRNQRPIMSSEQDPYNLPEISRRSTEQFGNLNSMECLSSVDMLFLGMISIWLLTGDYAFFDTLRSQSSSNMANTRHLTSLEGSSKWQQLAAAPKDFAGSLVSKDDATRLTAEQGLRHVWFSNNVHKIDFEEIYLRSIKHWKPNPVKAPPIEFSKSGSEWVKSLRCSRSLDIGRRQPQEKNLGKSIDSPYKPFPRKLHAASFWPKRASSYLRMSEEVKSAINNYWSPVPQTHQNVSPYRLRIGSDSLTNSPNLKVRASNSQSLTFTSSLSIPQRLSPRPTTTSTSNLGQTKFHIQPSVMFKNPTSEPANPVRHIVLKQRLHLPTSKTAFPQATSDQQDNHTSSRGLKRRLVCRKHQDNPPKKKARTSIYELEPEAR